MYSPQRQTPNTSYQYFTYVQIPFYGSRAPWPEWIGPTNGPLHSSHGPRDCVAVTSLAGPLPMRVLSNWGYGFSKHDQGSRQVTHRGSRNRITEYQALENGFRQVSPKWTSDQVSAKAFARVFINIGGSQTRITNADWRKSRGCRALIGCALGNRMASQNGGGFWYPTGNLSSE